MKKPKLLLTLLGCTMLLTSCKDSAVFDYNIENYDSYLIELNCTNKNFMPNLADLTDYSKIEFTYRFYGPYWFYTRTLLLQVEYNSENFEMKKDEIYNTYEFLDGPIKRPDDYAIPSASFKFNDYQINVVKNDLFFYPKYFGMIGINEAKNEIAYLYHKDNDLNCIHTKSSKPKDLEAAMVYFVNRNFVFK